jgi:hypothetical protein
MGNGVGALVWLECVIIISEQSLKGSRVLLNCGQPTTASDKLLADRVPGDARMKLV